MVKMDMKSLLVAALIIIAVAVITLVGMALTTEYSLALRLSNTSVDNVTFGAVNESVDVGGTGEYPFLQDATGCVNSSDGSQAILTTYYTVISGGSDGGRMKLLDDGALFAQTEANCTLSYLSGTAAQRGADGFLTGLAVLGTMIALLVLAVFGKVVMELFSRKD